VAGSLWAKGLNGHDDQQPTRTGRRKEAVARVRLLPGTGKHTINDRVPVEYLKRETLVQAAYQRADRHQTRRPSTTSSPASTRRPDRPVGRAADGDARALVREDEALKGLLGREGLLTRDFADEGTQEVRPAGARKRFQFSKR